ncbi:uncharacterized protein LOC120347777 [Styela clava]|uniref:uncharacterized protein LOC120347777 n=1 Tax=Styela clava TaxID=7725 RepID=UPI00193A2BB4|nr:uncharacterized protein LOC120347777 [Styela clava]XP_039273798.1 uncharacterized protein LOC120347777 [Styela clava]XP_039273799.1 uncharacterized protein LOC120347777 [Styela clava]
MNLSQYLVAVFVVQTVRCNTIGGIHSPRFTDEKENKNSKIGVHSNGDNTPKENGLITYDLTHHPSNEIMTPSDLLHMIMTSSDSSSSLIRVRRGSSSKSPRKKKCDPDDKECKKSRRKGKRKGGKRGEKGKKGRRKKKCKKGGKKGKRRCTDKGKGRNSPKPPPINAKTNLTFVPGTPGSDLRQQCIRTLDCPEGYCCARLHWERVCKPYVKLGEVCTRPRRKSRRSMEHYQRCPCEDHLACRREPGETEGKKNQLFKCHAKT